MSDYVYYPMQRDYKGELQFLDGFDGRDCFATEELAIQAAAEKGCYGVEVLKWDVN